MAKELVVYFSVYGTAKIVAEEIAKQTGAVIEEIEAAVPYDSNRDHYNALARLAKKEHDEDQRPAIKNEINVDSYDTIYIGYPMWWYTFPMIVYTFFDKYDFSGKTIIPFNTGGDAGRGKRSGKGRGKVAEEPQITIPQCPPWFILHRAILVSSDMRYARKVMLAFIVSTISQ